MQNIVRFIKNIISNTTGIIYLAWKNFPRQRPPHWYEIGQSLFFLLPPSQVTPRASIEPFP